MKEENHKKSGSRSKSRSGSNSPYNEKCVQLVKEPIIHKLKVQGNQEKREKSLSPYKQNGVVRKTDQNPQKSPKRGDNNYKAALFGQQQNGLIQKNNGK